MNYYETDPEFMERIDHFAFEEAVNEEGQQLEAPTRWLAILAALVGCQGREAYREFLPKALDDGLKPEAVKEMVYPIRGLCRHGADVAVFGYNQ